LRSKATEASSSERDDDADGPSASVRPYRTRPHRADIVAAVSKAIERFLGAAEVLGHPVEVRRFPEGTKTAGDAARAIGCEVGQIVKSLVFVAGDEPVLALTSGANLVDLDRLAALAGAAEARRANPEEARSATGFAVGGTPPFGHPERIRTFLDRDLLAFEEIWAAAGTPDAVFRTSPEELRRTSQAEVADLKEPRAGG
jgi:prolyl-tRNA editing enzyme YbaK/EbsC (Cys-tRNA(Pro) deacylase)